MAVEVKIRGTWRRCEQDYSIQQTAGAVATTKLRIKMESGDDALETHDLVQVYLDIAGTDYLIFTGNIRTVETPVWSTTFEAEVYPITVVSVESALNNRMVSRNWYGKTYSQIVTDLYNDYIDEENVTLGTISTTSTVIRKYSAQDKKISEILDDIADKVGACTYYITPGKEFNFVTSSEFPSVTAPTHITKLKRSSDYADVRTIQKVRGASTRITGTATNSALISDIATRSGLSGKIENLIVNTDIHNPTDAGTEAAAQLANYAEDEETITCTCHDLDATELYNEWSLDYSDLGIVGYYVVIERTIRHFVDDAVIINVKLQNRNYFSRIGYTIKKALVSTKTNETSIGDNYNEDALTPSEKITTRRQWYATVEEKTLLDSQADAYSVSRVAYDAAFQALADYLNAGSAWSTGLPTWIDADNISVITEIDDDEYIEIWNDYFIARDTLRHNIEDAIEAAAEAAEMRVFASVALLEAATGVRDEEVVTCLGEFYKWDATNSEWDKMTGSVLPLPTLQISPRFVPAIPDDPAGTTYRSKPGWTTGVDGWLAGYPASCTLSIEAGRLKAVETSRTYIQIYRSGMGAISAKQFVFRVTSLYKIQSIRYWTGSTTVTFSKIIKISDYEWIVAEVITSLSTPVLIVYTTETANTVWYSDIYLGTGAYLTPALDESGNGNHLTNRGVIPGVEGGRQVLLFNGQNSRLYSTGPKTGAVCTLHIKLIRPAATIGTPNIPVSDCNADSGWYFYFLPDNTSRIAFYLAGTGYISANVGPALTDSTNPHTFDIVVTGTKMHTYVDGVLINSHSTSMVASTGVFSIGRNPINANYYAVKLLELYITDKVLTQDQITWFVANGLPEPRYTYENYLLDKAADDGSMSPADKASELTDWMEHWYEDERNTALPTTFGSITTAGKYKETATIANTAGIWTPTTASTAAKTYYDASEAYRAVLFNYSTAGTGFLLRVNRDTATDISGLSPTLNALRTALVAAETALRDEALRILTRKLNISGATSYGYEGGATVPDPTNLVLTAAATGFTPSTYKWQYYDSGWTDLANDSGKVAGVATSELTIYYNATPWGTARYLRVRCLADSEVYQEVTLTKIYDGVDGTSITLEGSVAEPADLADIVAPDVGDLYTCLAGGIYGGVTYAAGDGAAWDGSAWFNAGPIQGPAGTNGASSYLHIKFSAYSDGTDFGNTTDVYIGRAVTTSATAPTDKGDYTWTKWIGDDATSYTLSLNADSLKQSVAGAFTPATVTASLQSQTGTGIPAAYSGRFIIAEYDGSSWSDEYTSSGNESSKEYTPSDASVQIIRVRAYLAGGTTTLIGEKQCVIVQDGSDAGKNLGRYHDSHPSSYNDRDRWLVYADPVTYTIQPGVWYSDLGTPTRVTIASDVDVRCFMAEFISDVAWAEAQGTYGSASDYDVETLFQAIAAVEAFFGALFTNELSITQGGSIHSSNFSTGVSGWSLEEETAEFNDVIVRGLLDAVEIRTGSAIFSSDGCIALKGDTDAIVFGEGLCISSYDQRGNFQTGDMLYCVGHFYDDEYITGQGIASVMKYASALNTWAAYPYIVENNAINATNVYIAKAAYSATTRYSRVSIDAMASWSECEFYTEYGANAVSIRAYASASDKYIDAYNCYIKANELFSAHARSLGTNTYKWVNGYFSGDLYCAGITATGNISTARIWAGIVSTASMSRTITSFANWFSPAAKEVGEIYYNDGAYAGSVFYSMDDTLNIIHKCGDAGYIGKSGTVIKCKAARSGYEMKFTAVRYV